MADAGEGEPVLAGSAALLNHELPLIDCCDDAPPPAAAAAAARVRVPPAQRRARQAAMRAAVAAMAHAQAWRCCGRTFMARGAAQQHVARAHPERLQADETTAVVASSARAGLCVAAAAAAEVSAPDLAARLQQCLPPPCLRPLHCAVNPYAQRRRRI